jgi:hypothetical protein
MRSNRFRAELESTLFPEKEEDDMDNDPDLSTSTSFVLTDGESVPSRPHLPQHLLLPLLFNLLI